MKIMLCILGEGRGHLTQAMAVKAMVETAGHQVVSVVVGASPHRRVPAYFASAMKMPIVSLPTLEFKYKNDKAVNLSATLASLVRKIPTYWRGVRRLRTLVRKTQPDVILNFFEPLTGLYALTSRQRPPVVAIAHQFMFEHPDYVRAPGMRVQQFGMKLFVKLVGSASTKLALSLYEAPDLPEKNLFVGPPLLREQLFELTPKPAGDFVLAYLLNHGYAEQIIAWHQKNPQTVLHCFYDKPDAPPEFHHDATLAFHRLDGEKFLQMMAECKYVACTAGFESVCEAAYLGKPLFMVPVENHVEQQINAVDSMRCGFGIAAKNFNFDRLAELPDRLDNGKFRTWLHRADKVLLETIEHAVHPPTPIEARQAHLAV